MKVTIGDKSVEFKDITDPLFIELLPLCAKNTLWTTLGSFEVIYSLYCNVRHLVENDILGDIVECGVWKGGMMQMAALTLARIGDTKRKIYLYDTYDGMPPPDEIDIDWDGTPAQKLYDELGAKGQKMGFGGTLDSVRAVMEQTGYPADNLIFVKGLVEDTIPATIPDQIALLRLDTDFYRSTYHELHYLYPRLVKSGFVIIDDYGVYQGARKATDQYFSETKAGIFLSRINFSVRLGIKP